MYKIKLPVFEGPFDLLLFLIKKNEIDIYDIPISQITREYLEYLELMTMLDLEVAGEFIEMVATLILIKTRMLLPRPEGETEEVSLEDPRMQLTLQLLQYKRYKQASEYLDERETDHRRYFARKSNERRLAAERAVQDDDFEIDATLFDLMTAFKRALDNMPRITVHQVKTYKFTLEDQGKYIIGRLSGRSHIHFSDLVEGMPEKIYLVVTFMAILDMMKLNMISAKQAEVFGDIRLVPNGEMSLSRYEMLKENQDIDPFATELPEEG